jgi:hypothetical protein
MTQRKQWSVHVTITFIVSLATITSCTCSKDIPCLITSSLKKVSYQLCEVGITFSESPQLAKVNQLGNTWTVSKES